MRSVLEVESSAPICLGPTEHSPEGVRRQEIGGLRGERTTDGLLFPPRLRGEDNKNNHSGQHWQAVDGRSIPSGRAEKAGGRAELQCTVQTSTQLHYRRNTGAHRGRSLLVQCLADRRNSHHERAPTGRDTKRQGQPC